MKIMPLYNIYLTDIEVELLRTQFGVPIDRKLLQGIIAEKIKKTLGTIGTEKFQVVVKDVFGNEHAIIIFDTEDEAKSYVKNNPLITKGSKYKIRRTEEWTPVTKPITVEEPEKEIVEPGLPNVVSETTQTSPVIELQVSKRKRGRPKKEEKIQRLKEVKKQLEE